MQVQLLESRQTASDTAEEPPADQSGKADLSAP